jgi:ferredoxin
MREVIRDKRDEPDTGLISALVHEEAAECCPTQAIGVAHLRRE